MNSPPPGVWLRGLPGLILATGHLLPVAGVQTMCQIDHADDWSSGGLTDLKLLGPACQFHNRDRYRHPTRYTRRKIGADRWAFTYRNPRTARLRV
ncbi:hypothetical protein [Microbispora triticiradicis]|uniref:hypothetical protein n=1 Tax=Microbispora triticiradicis TaxID=2200763 RepID=UPI001058CCC6|nr:hypothetical protein [Microbispora triticiradicis]